MKEGFLAVVFIGIVIGAVWLGSHWQDDRKVASDTRPSIEGLKQASLPPAEKADISKEDSQAETAAKKQSQVEEKPEDKAKLALKVLNGGAPKGTASKVQAALKTAGYAKAETGNTKADYTGTTVYFLEGFSASAEQVKQALAKEYPNVQAKQADPKKEEGAASVTVVLGR